jgi:hypothetical protein
LSGSQRARRRSPRAFILASLCWRPGSPEAYRNLQEIRRVSAHLAAAGALPYRDSYGSESHGRAPLCLECQTRLGSFALASGVESFRSVSRIATAATCPTISASVPYLNFLTLHGERGWGSSSSWSSSKSHQEQA